MAPDGCASPPDGCRSRQACGAPTLGPMKWLLVLVLAIAAAIALAVFAARLVDQGRTRLEAVRRWAWAIGTTALLVLGVYAAHAIGLFSVPIVALAFLLIGIPARAYLGATRARRERREAATEASRALVRPAPEVGLAAFLARHELVVLAVLGCCAAAAAGAVAVVVGPH